MKSPGDCQPTRQTNGTDWARLRVSPTEKDSSESRQMDAPVENNRLFPFVMTQLRGGFSRSSRVDICSVSVPSYFSPPVYQTPSVTHCRLPKPRPRQKMGNSCECRVGNPATEAGRQMWHRWKSNLASGSSIDRGSVRPAQEGPWLNSVWALGLSLQSKVVAYGHCFCDFALRN